MTREQFAVMLYRFANPAYWVNAQLLFLDAEQVSPWAQDAIRWAVEGDIIRGTDGMLHPQGAISRAECAAMLLRFSRYAATEWEPVLMDFHVRYERTVAHPPVFFEYPIVIRSMDDLSAYMEFYSEHVLRWDMYGDPVYMNDVVFGMYTEEFFRESFLIIFHFEENSGSNWHRVDAVLDNGDIYVTRHVPIAGTPDVASWHILLEIDSNIIPKQINLTVTTERVYL